jgi:adenine C2-methylase RlmN of 23S rRNA A2503 and tRNA A37
LTDEKTYKDESLKKIKELQTALKKKGLSVEERQKIRNKISAQQSRLKKKEEFSTLFV